MLWGRVAWLLVWHQSPRSIAPAEGSGANGKVSRSSTISVSARFSGVPGRAARHGGWGLRQLCPSPRPRGAGSPGRPPKDAERDRVIGAQGATPRPQRPTPRRPQEGGILPPKGLNPGRSQGACVGPCCGHAEAGSVPHVRPGGSAHRPERVVHAEVQMAWVFGFVLPRFGVFDADDTLTGLAPGPPAWVLSRTLLRLSQAVSRASGWRALLSPRPVGLVPVPAGFRAPSVSRPPPRTCWFQERAQPRAPTTAPASESGTRPPGCP